MTAFVIRRILYGIPTLLGAIFVIFFIFNVLPGQDPALQLAGRHASVETIEVIRHELGLDKSLPMQFLDLVRQTFTFDFGRSYATKEKISTMLAEGAGPSLSLVIPPFLISILIGVLGGFLVVLYRGRFLDKFVVALCVVLQSVSILVYILAGQYFLAYKMGIFPITGYDESWAGRWRYLALPGIIYVLLSLAPEIRFYRTAILDEVYQDYVRTARSKGLGTSAIMLKHVLKNAMVPIITDVVISIPFLILGVLVLEGFFGIPGLGDLIVRALANNDRPVLIATTVLGTVAFVVFNIISDVLYAVADPRIQLK